MGSVIAEGLESESFGSKCLPDTPLNDCLDYSCDMFEQAEKRFSETLPIAKSENESQVSGPLLILFRNYCLLEIYSVNP